MLRLKLDYVGNLQETKNYSENFFLAFVFIVNPRTQEEGETKVN